MPNWLLTPFLFFTVDAQAKNIPKYAIVGCLANEIFTASAFALIGIPPGPLDVGSAALCFINPSAAVAANTLDLAKLGNKLNDLDNAKDAVKGIPPLGDIFRSVANSGLSAAEKAREIADRVKGLAGEGFQVAFNRLPDIPGTEAVFKGAPRAIDGKSPVLAVFEDGRIFQGLEDGLIPDPSGVTNGLRILANKFKEFL